MLPFFWLNGIRMEGYCLETDPKLALVIAGNFTDDEENADPTMLLRYLPQDIVGCCEFIEWSTQPSSHYSMQLTLEMANMLEKLVESGGYTGVIVISGSGVMEEMAYLTDLIWQHSEPCVFANLMVRGRAGVEEGLVNLRCSVQAVLSPEARDKGVMVCSSGEFFAGSEVVMVDPATPENTFQSPGKGSIGKVLNDEVKFFRNPRRPEFLARKPEGVGAVDVVLSTLGGGARIMSALASNCEVQGIIIAASGTGSVSPTWMPHIRNILRRRIPVAVVSRSFEGQVIASSNFEGSFTKLMEIGVMSGGKLNPYQARIRMALGLAAGLTDQGLRLYMLNQPVNEDIPTLYK